MSTCTLLWAIAWSVAGAGEPMEDAPQAVARVLDDFHAAAAAADEERYFAHFAEGGVFLGTAAEERWSVAAFRQYAHPHFAAGRGWFYAASERHVTLSPDGAVAWFDERLWNEKYGELRGTGVLRRTSGAWKIAHYSLTFLVPNERSQAVVAAIRGEARDPRESAENEGSGR
jgi:ketosteroid isomerase-like protein